MRIVAMGIQSIRIPQLEVTAIDDRHERYVSGPATVSGEATSENGTVLRFDNLRLTFAEQRALDALLKRIVERRMAGISS